VHDYFDILGVSSDARPAEIRRACCRRVPATHPDIRLGDDLAVRRPRATPSRQRIAGGEFLDASIDFVEASALVDAMRARFFECATTSTR
jgi:hypothetical protein